MISTYELTNTDYVQSMEPGESCAPAAVVAELNESLDAYQKALTKELVAWLTTTK